MIPNMSEASGWYQCVCGYDSRSYVSQFWSNSSDFGYEEREKRMARRLKDIIIHLDYEDEYKDGKVEVNIIASEPEELVRCKDCKYNVLGECAITNMIHQDESFCSWGVEK